MKLMNLLRPKISEVFTPRRAEVNHCTYIARPVLEKELKRSLEGSLHSLIYGNSGTGKSWLYKRVLGEMNAQCAIANCANAERFGSVTDEIVNTVLPYGDKQIESIEEEMKASVSAVVASGGAKSKRTYKVLSEDPLLSSFKHLRETAGSQMAVLVLDNLESIVANETLMNEVGNIIILCDDHRYSQYRIKILIVGVPSSVLDYFANVKNLATVANRIHELSEVSNFTDTQVSAFVERGFVNLLSVSIDKPILDEWKSHIYNVTLGIPQRLHEYCEILGHILEDSKWNPTVEMLEKADVAWIKQGLRESYVVVDSLMNARETEIGRRNQVLYALGLNQIHYFTPKHISDRLKKEFPESTNGVTLGVGTILADLASRENSIIKKSSNGNRFEFTDLRYVMVLRTMLKKEKDKVKKLGFRL